LDYLFFQNPFLLGRELSQARIKTGNEESEFIRPGTNQQINRLKKLKAGR